jgi:pyruvate/2-oxoglutarate dehydrogenase complex dihydrolipoamide dehydrogenase (E3) component
MIILGARVVALEMVQSFARLGSKVIVINRFSRLFESKLGDIEAAQLLQRHLEEDDGVIFLSSTSVKQVSTLQGGNGEEIMYPSSKL